MPIDKIHNLLLYSIEKGNWFYKRNCCGKISLLDEIKRYDLFRYLCLFYALSYNYVFYAIYLVLYNYICNVIEISELCFRN